MPQVMPHRFVTAEHTPWTQSPWADEQWLSKPGLTDPEALQLVRATMPAGKGHAFHRHPLMEEIIYVEAGQAEQWVEQEFRILKPGEMAHVPRDVVHATFNPSDQPLVFLAILSPAKIDGPAMVDVAHESPWCHLRQTNAEGDIIK